MTDLHTDCHASFALSLKVMHLFENLVRVNAMVALLAAAMVADHSRLKRIISV